MQSKRPIIALLSLLLLLAACETRRGTPAPQINTETGGDVSGAVIDSPNEATPTTADSLEISESKPATFDNSLTASGTVVSGTIDNPHRLMLFSDYDCAYCREFMTSDLRWIENELVARGALSVERVFVPMSQDGDHAARLAVCAAEQKKFPEADRWLSTHAIAAIDVEKFAKAIGVNVKKLLACTANKDLLAGNLQKAYEFGVQRVPFFVLGSDSWLGLVTREELREKIEEALR